MAGTIHDGERPRVSHDSIPPRPDLTSAAPVKGPVRAVHRRSVEELSIEEGLACQRRHDATGHDKPLRMRRRAA